MSKFLDQSGLNPILAQIKAYLDSIKSSFAGTTHSPDPYFDKEKFTVVVANCPTSKIRISFDGVVEYEGIWYKGQGNARTWILDPGVEVVVEALGELNWEGHYYELPEYPVKRFITTEGGRHYIEMEYTQIPWDAGYEDTVCILNQSDEVNDVTFSRSGGDALYHILDDVMYFGWKRVGNKAVIAQFDDAYKGQNHSIRDRNGGWTQLWRFADGTRMDCYSINRQGWYMCGLRKFCWKTTELRDGVTEIRFHYGTAPDGSWEEWDSNLLWGFRAAYEMERVSDGKKYNCSLYDKLQWLSNTRGVLYKDSNAFGYTFPYNSYEERLDPMNEDCPGWNMADWDTRCTLAMMMMCHEQTYKLSNVSMICDGMYHVGRGGDQRHEYLPRRTNWVENYDLHILSRSGNSRIKHVAPGYGGLYGRVDINRFFDLYPKLNASKWQGAQYWINASYSFVTDQADPQDLPQFSYDPSTSNRNSRMQFCGDATVIEGAEFVKLPFEFGTWEDECRLAGIDPVKREAELDELNKNWNRR